MSKDELRCHVQQLGGVCAAARMLAMDVARMRAVLRGRARLGPDLVLAIRTETDLRHLVCAWNAAYRRVHRVAA